MKNKVILKKMLSVSFVLIFVFIMSGATTKAATAEGDVVIGDVRVQLLSDSIIRIELKDQGTFEDRNTYRVVDRSFFNGVEYTTNETSENLEIITSEFKVVVPKNATSLEGIYVEDVRTIDGEVLWEFTELPSNSQFLPTPYEKADVFAISDTPRIIVPEHNYSDVSSADVLNGYEINEDAQDVYVFVPFGDARKLRQDYINLFGPSEMLPLKTFGSWDSRYYAYTQEEAIQQILDYAEHNFPLDNMVIDTDWRENTGAGGIGYDINTDLFPDMEGFLTWAKENNVSIIFNDHPEPYNGAESVLDPKEVAYREEKLTDLLKLGITAWWYDRNWHTALISPTEKIAKETWGMYLFYQITENYYQGLTEDEAYAIRSYVMGNADDILHGAYLSAGDITSHRYSLQWTGDITASSYSLSTEIEDMIRAGSEALIPYLSADIGGHVGNPSNEMYIRWTQYGALSPIYRPHSSNIVERYRMPWFYGEQAENVARDYVNMRYRLLPLYYALAHENYETGMPIMRSLDFNYPNYIESTRTDQYLLGNDILVAPITDADEVVKAEYFSNLKAEFYNNKTLTGTKVDFPSVKNIDFNWGQGSPMPGIGSDNFSARFEGELTLPENGSLSIVTDDGVKVWIDDVLVVDEWRPSNSELFVIGEYEANETHSIKIEYYEESGGAYLNMFYTPETGIKNDRTVFIPDGTWIDVWSGESYVGPQTVTVSHGIETSPIFVRQGSIVALAENMLNTSEKDWSNMTLDVYPSTKYSGTSTIYEDDTVTVGFKDGQYRKTELQTFFDNNDDSFVVKVNAAVGSFEGELAFTERNYKVRMHVPKEWGNVSSVIIGDQLVTPVLINQSSYAQPFANSGASLDSDIYEIEFTGNVYDTYEARFYFESYNELDNVEYDSNEIDFTVDKTKLEYVVDLSKNNIYEWAHFGAETIDTVIRKADVVVPQIGDLIIGGEAKMFYNNIPYKWNDGDLLATSTGNSNGPVSSSDFKLNVKTTTEKQTLILYVGGYKSQAKMVIHDSAGNVKTLNFGNDNSNYYQKVIIEMSSENEGMLYIDYKKLSGDNITFSAAAISDHYVDNSAQLLDANVVVNEVSSTVNLTSVGTLDWIYNKNNGINGLVRKNISEIQKVIMNPLYDVSTNFNDYNSNITYSDGDIVTNGSSRDGVASNKGFKTYINITDEISTIHVYLGAWRAASQVVIKDQNNNVLYDQVVAEGGSVADIKELVIDPTMLTTESSYLIVEINKVDTGFSEGNVSLVAVAVKAKEVINVTLNPNNGNDPIIVEIAENGTFEKPQSPVKEGYVFDKWLTESNVEYTFGGIITESFELTASYIKNAINNVEILNNTTSTNLTHLGDVDWLYSQHGGENGQIRKNIIEENMIISNLTYLSSQDFYDYGTYMHYTDGNYQSTRQFRDGVASAEVITTDIKVTSDVKVIRLYLGAWQNTNIVRVIDENGFIHQEIEAVVADNTSQSRVLKLVVDDSFVGKTLTITSSPKDNTQGNVSLVAVAVSKNVDSLETISLETTLSDVVADISLDGKIDWIHQGYVDGMDINRKLDANILNAPTAYDDKWQFHDYRPISWTDGTPNQTITTQHGAQSRLGFYTTVDATIESQRLELYLGAWHAKNLITITDENGTVLKEIEFSAGDSSVQKLLTIDFTSLEAGSTLVINVIAKDTYAGGNVSLVALALSETPTP